jgi:2-polyprenyl-6-methoxyphenol hydroxylase-like FAD-dependent oxidoreductase
VDVDPDAAAAGLGLGVVELNVLLLFEHALFRASRDVSAIGTHKNRKNGTFIFYFKLAQGHAAISREFPERFWFISSLKKRPTVPRSTLRSGKIISKRKTGEPQLPFKKSIDNRYIGLNLEREEPPGAQRNTPTAQRSCEMKRPPILISGAGIAGSTLAYWLHRRGFEPTLIERASRFRESGYMIDFWGIGYDVAESMGLLPQLNRAGYKIDRLTFVNEKDDISSELRGDALRRAIGERFISLPRGDLARAIFDTIAGKIEVIFSESVKSVRTDSKAVEVAFKNSPSRRFGVVAGCGGLHSTIRSLVFGSEDQFEKYLGYYAASFITTGYSRRNEHTYLSYAAPGRQISRYALRGDHTAFLFVFSREQPLKKQPDREEIKKLLWNAFGRDSWTEIAEIFDHLERCNDLCFDAVSQIQMPAWSSGLSVLVGDAAYAPSLLAGEGAGLAMAGAYILAGELERANGDHAAAFFSYECRLRNFIQRKQLSARRNAGSFAPKTRTGLFARNVVLRLASNPIVSNWIMRRFLTDEFELPDYTSR